jgi:hypothetical protein
MPAIFLWLAFAFHKGKKSLTAAQSFPPGSRQALKERLHMA